MIAQQKWRFGMEFFAEIWDVALLGGISATIGNQCCRICSRRSSKGRICHGSIGGRTERCGSDASPAVRSFTAEYGKAECPMGSNL